SSKVLGQHGLVISVGCLQRSNGCRIGSGISRQEDRDRIRWQGSHRDKDQRESQPDDDKRLANARKKIAGHLLLLPSALQNWGGTGGEVHVHAAMRTINLYFIPQRESVRLVHDQAALFFSDQFSVFFRICLGTLSIEDLHQVFISVEEHRAFGHTVGGTQSTVNKLAGAKDLYGIISVSTGKERIVCSTVDQSDTNFTPLLLDHFKHWTDNHGII